jgi:DNA repair photolyase
MDREEFHKNVKCRKNVIEQFEKDCKKLSGTDKSVLLSFSTDPYQPIEQKERLTRRAVELMNFYDIPYTILTKNINIQEDMSIFKRRLATIGFSISCIENYREWEPNASDPRQRLKVLQDFHDNGYYNTFVSFEPIINPFEVIDCIRKILNGSIKFKLGKINHGDHGINIDYEMFCKYVSNMYLWDNDALFFKRSLHKYLR